MKVRYSKTFLRQYKSASVRIQYQVDERLRIFRKDPPDPQLKNYELKREYLGYRSINITADWRAIYKKKQEATEKVAYFILLGTHKQLYK